MGRRVEWKVWIREMWFSNKGYFWITASWNIRRNFEVRSRKASSSLAIHVQMMWRALSEGVEARTWGVASAERERRMSEEGLERIPSGFRRIGTCDFGGSVKNLEDDVEMELCWDSGTDVVSREDTDGGEDRLDCWCSRRFGTDFDQWALGRGGSWGGSGSSFGIVGGIFRAC